MSRPQFTLRALLVLMLAAGCFFGGIRFERERRRRADEALEAEFADVPVLEPYIVTGRDGKETIISH
jgi:hypothetical protein